MITTGVEVSCEGRLAEYLLQHQFLDSVVHMYVEVCYHHDYFITLNPLFPIQALGSYHGTEPTRANSVVGGRDRTNQCHCTAGFCTFVRMAKCVSMAEPAARAGGSTPTGYKVQEVCAPASFVQCGQSSTYVRILTTMVKLIWSDQRVAYEMKQHAGPDTNQSL